MVSIVIVSHSEKVAEGVKEISLQMARDFKQIVAVGGTETGEIGTDPMRIQSAIEEVYTDDGVVVFADLGSAVMSVGIAKELMEPQMAERVFLADAPLIEGCIAATVEAAMGANVDTVLKTATEARNIEKIL